MADDNYFSQLDQSAAPEKPDQPSDNYFAQFDTPQPSEPSAAEAFAHHAEGSALPAAVGLAGAGAGAEMGAAVGLLGGPAAPFTVPAGAIIGGITGAITASTAASTAQDYAVKAMPDNWQEFLGQSERQKQAEEEKHPTASFIGGFVPYLLTMRPGGWGKAALPENATAWQKIAANPLTAHLFSGGVMGGMELGNEVIAGQKPNWTHVGIATGFGVIFNKPTKIGDSLTELGARPVRKALGIPSPEGAPADQPEVETPAETAAPTETPAETPAKDWAETILGGKAPTVAQAGDAKVMGPGITEDVFMGGHAQAPEAEMAAQDAARTEQMTLNPTSPEVPTIARRMEPELFDHYDALTAQRDDLAARLAQIGTPVDEEIATLSKQRDTIEDKLTAEPQSKTLNAQMADAQAQLEEVVARRDNEPESAELAALRQHLAATEAQLHEIGPELAAAHRRADERINGPEGATSPTNAPSPAPEAPNIGAEAPSSLPLPEQEAAIVSDVTQRLIAAGYSAPQASANAQVLGRRYVTRAARLNGALGSPLELYHAQGPEIRAYGRSPLMPTLQEPNLPVPDVSRGAEPTVAENATVGAPEAASGAENAQVASRPSELESIDPATIGVDAKRFQFKAGSDESGVSERLQDVAQWDPRLAGTALVWRDEIGKNWIADGHQRLGLAKRLIEQGQVGIRLNAFVLDSASGISDVEARMIAAAKNIAEGTGSAIDAAKIIRGAKEQGIDLPPLPPRSALTRDGKALSELSPEAFGMVVNEVIPANQGAIIGRLVKDPAQQVEAARLLAKLQPDNARQAEMVVRDMLASGTEDGTQQNLFGEEAFANSVVLERAKIADEAIKQLRRDRSTFRTLVDEAERIQGAGANVLDQTANASRLTTDEKAADLLTQLAFRAGPVSDELSRISRRFKSGELTAAGAAREFLGTIREAVESGVDTGADAGGAELGPNGEREGLGPELFQPAPPIDTPAFNNWFGDSKVVDEHGAPLVVYHGTDADFGAFERSDDIGFHFGTRAQANARVTDEGRTIEGANLMPVYLRIEHPYRMPDLNIWEPQVVLSQLEKDGIITAKQADEAGDVDRVFVRNALEAKGYDGIVYKNGVEGKGEPPADSYIALDPTQIKSVNNRGTFDPNDPRILYQSKPAPWSEGEKLGEFDTERGLEGLPQSLIPGVKPMTDAERIAAEAAKPLKGGEAPAKAGGLFDVEGREDAAKQMTLFQPAYHGTPHIFDKFDSSKIGTGEGAQAFGHGLYFAGRKGVAEYYREKLATGAAFKKDGVGPTISYRDAVGEILGVIAKHVNLKEHPEDADLPLLIADDALGTVLGRESLDNLRQIILKNHPDREALADAAIAEAKRYQSTKPGRLLTVDIPEEHELLDWDKPLSEQPKGVQERLATLGFTDPAPDTPTGRKTETGESAYRKLVGRFGAGSNERGQVAASAALREAGIPGHRFLDQASRNPKALADAKGSLSVWETALKKNPDDAYIKSEVEARRVDVAKLEAEQSHNYVIYDDSRINVTNYEQSKRGSITFAEGKRPLIKLFRDADASTVLHETGHQWLEELMSDSQHPAAGETLRDDAQTVRDWLGIKDIGAPIKTAQHEKFARGFEQYMREGIAPSAKLARVFAQFKTWLTSIYQSIKGLGSPISEDIRSVFDRMIETEPHRTVIGEGREGVQGITDLHEHEAATVPPHEAEPALDRIVAERDRVIAEQPTEIQNELARATAAFAPPAESGQGAGGPADVVAGGGGPEPQSAGGAGGGERSAQLAGRTQAGAEGNGAESGAGADTGLRPERSGAANDARSSNTLAPNPRAVLGAQESPFLDKAGNIRLDTLTNNEDARQAIRDAADANNDFLGDRGGPVTRGQLEDLAEAAGMEGAEDIVGKRVKGQAFNPVEVMTLRKALVQSAINLSALAKKAHATGSAADELAYVQAELRHTMLQGTVAQATAVWGRTGLAFRSLVEGQTTAKNVDQLLRQATGKTLFQTKQRIAAMALMDRPERVSKFINDAQKRSLGRMLQYYIVNNLISNPITHITYAAGNGLLLAKKMVIDTPGAALIGEARAMAGYKGDRVRLGEVPAAFAGLWRGLPPALRAVGQAARTGVQARLPSDTSQFTLPFQHGAENATHANVDMTTTWHDLVSDGYGMIAGVPNALKAMSSMLAAGGVKGSPLISARYSPLGPIPDLMVRGMPALPIGTTVGMAGRLTAVIHSLFNVLDYSVDISQRAYRQAVNEGLTGNSLARRVGELTQNPPEDMMEKAVSGAKDMTLMGKSGDFMSRVSRLVDWEIDLPILGNTQPLRFIDPFVKIAGAMAKQSVGTQTPVGLLSMVAPDRSELGADLRGRNGAAAQDMAVAKMVTGTAVALGFLGLKMAGNMTGGGPSDPHQAAVWRMQGYQPYSIRIGDIFVPVHRLGPLGFLAGLGADMFDVSKSASKGDMQKAAGQFLFSFSQNFLDEGFMRGPGDMMKAIENPDREGERYLSNLAGEFIPFSQATNQFAKSLDPYQRQSRTFMDSLKAKLPWISETLEPRRDIFGQPIATLQSGPSFGPTSMYETQFNNDPVLKAFTELGIFPGPVQRTIRGIQLTDQQYDDYARVAGVTMHMQLEKFVTSPMWQTLPPQARFDLIQAQIKAGRETARNYVMMKYPTIPAQAARDKLAPFQAPDQ